MARAYADRDLKLLFGLSAFYCAFPNCPKRLVALANGLDDDAVLGHIAHIVAYSNEGPRGDGAIPESMKNKYDNLLLLCRHHHGLVDEQPNSYSIEDLRAWKEALEAKVTESLARSMRTLDFAELEMVCKHLISGQSALASTPMVAVPPALKMDANGLTNKIGYRMRLGLMQAPQVEDFLAEYASRFDSDYPNRLRAGFIAQYSNYVRDGLSGDALFLALAEWAGSVSPAEPQSINSIEYQGAGLAVLCHLFEICDVFEAPSDSPQ